MNPGRQPFKRYTRWTPTSASDQNRLRAAVEDLQRAAAASGAEGGGEGRGIVGGVPVAIPRQPEEFWIQITGPPTAGAYFAWRELIQDGTGGFLEPADAMRGDAGFLAHELRGRFVNAGTIARAYLSQSEPLCVVFDVGMGGGEGEGDAVEASLWCNVTTGPLILQDQERVASVIRLDPGLYKVNFAVTFRSPEAFEWSGNCKSAAFLWEVDRTASSVTVQASTGVDVPRWGIDARGHLGTDSHGSGSGSGSGSGPPPEGGGATCENAQALTPGVPAGPYSLAGGGQAWFKFPTVLFGTYHVTFATLSGPTPNINVLKGTDCSSAINWFFGNPNGCVSGSLAGTGFGYVQVVAGVACTFTIEIGAGPC